MLGKAGRPLLITAVCPTYGRWTVLRDVLTCFANQDYQHKRLLILNDAPKAIHCNWPGVTVINSDKRYETLGHKRNACIEIAKTSLIAHWDDDDLYLPWHLSEAVRAMQESGKGFVKPKRAWRLYGKECEYYTLRPPRANRYEGQLSFRRDAAFKYGAYTPMWSGQCKQMMSNSDSAGDFLKYEPHPSYSYLYRWKSAVSHISSRGNTIESHNVFALKNNDFGDGVLLPGHLGCQASAILEQAPRMFESEEVLEGHDAAGFITGLQCWLERPVP